MPAHEHRQYRRVASACASAEIEMELLLARGYGVDVVLQTVAGEPLAGARLADGVKTSATVTGWPALAR